MHALGVFHPLLLEPSLPPLKEPPATEAVNYDAAASPGSSAVADSMGKASWEPQQPPRQMYGHRGRPKGKVPCPVDLLVPAGVKVVAVTGPNTGVVPAACSGAPITFCVSVYRKYFVVLMLLLCFRMHLVPVVFTHVSVPCIVGSKGCIECAGCPCHAF